jgi:hypothetical protein
MAAAQGPKLSAFAGRQTLALSALRLYSLARRFSALQGRERLCLLPATASLLLARLRLRWLPLRKVLQWAELPVAETNNGSAPVDPRTRCGIRAAERAGHWLFPRNPCLTQALVVHRLLRRRGHASELRIGIRATSGKLQDAHAWVEYGGVVWIGERGLSESHIPLPPLGLSEGSTRGPLRRGTGDARHHGKDAE